MDVTVDEQAAYVVQLRLTNDQARRLALACRAVANQLGGANFSEAAVLAPAYQDDTALSVLTGTLLYDALAAALLMAARVSEMADVPGGYLANAAD